MPYADPEKQRKYKAAWARARRIGSTGSPVSVSPAALPQRVQTAQDILDLLSATVADVRADPRAGALEKARVLGFLSGVALKAVEVAGLASRLAELEDALAIVADGD